MYLRVKKSSDYSIWFGLKVHDLTTTVIWRNHFSLYEIVDLKVWTGVGKYRENMNIISWGWGLPYENNGEARCRGKG